MNRLYLLGALALSNVSAYMTLSTTAAPTQFGTTTYTATGDDCYATGTATTLSMSNIYYQYYSFTIAAPTITDGTATLSTATPQATTVNAVAGCYHSHMYNWMGQPQLGSSGVTDGLGEAVVAYGYVMEGSTLAACALKVSAVSTTLYSSTTKVFSGPRFQHVTATYTPVGTATVITESSANNVGLLVDSIVHYGPGALRSVTSTVVAYVATPTPSPGTSTIGLALTSSANVYWDFAQSTVFQGQTQFGRGGGATTAPCGWWVFYANEGGLMTDGSGSSAYGANAWNAVMTSWGTATVHMWTDNAMTNTLGAFVLAAIGAALY